MERGSLPPSGELAATGRVTRCLQLLAHPIANPGGISNPCRHLERAGHLIRWVRRRYFLPAQGVGAVQLVSRVRLSVS